MAYRFEGPLFFGGAHMALLELTEVSDIRVVILRMSHVTTLDATGAAVLADTIRSLERRDVAVLMSGLPDAFTRRPRLPSACTTSSSSGVTCSTTRPRPSPTHGGT